MNDNVASAADGVSENANAIVEYSATERGLAEFRHKYEKVVFDVATTAGDKQAREARRELVGLRTSLDKLRKQLNQDDQARINARNEKAKEITTQIEALEEPIDAQIRAQEEEADRKREAKRQAEAAARAAVEAELSAIRNMPLAYVSAGAEELRGLIETLASNTLEQFDEVYLPTAQQAKDDALEALRRLLAEREALEAQRAELDRLQREAAERDQAEAERRAADEEADRIAREKRQAVDRAIAAIAGIPALAAAENSEQIGDRLQALVGTELKATAFGDRLEEAEAAQNTAIKALDALLTAARVREAAAAENARIAEAQADQQRKLDAQATAQREEADRAEQARREQQEREEADRRAAAQAESDRVAEEQRRRWENRTVAPDSAMNGSELNALCSLLLASDPSPLTEGQHVDLSDWADHEARKHGFEGWVDALHGFVHLHGELA